MTINQIKAEGIVTNKWDNLQNICRSFLFSNEGYEYVSPRSTQFYFEESSELLFVRYIKLPLSKVYFEDSVEVNLQEGNTIRTYYGKLLPGGAVDKTVGKYHNVYDVTQITAILS